MSFSEQQIRQLTKPLCQALGDNISWSFEPRHQVMLSEFAQNKSDLVLARLREQLPHEWCDKTWKKLPKVLKSELGDLAKLKQGQKLLALTAGDNTPAIVALWWPWGHGGTYSLRLKLLDIEYQDTAEPDGSAVVNWFKRLFTMS